MREQLRSARSLRFISIVEAAMIVYLVALLIYLLANVSQNSTVTVGPSFAGDSPAISSPNATSQQSVNSAATSTATYNSI